MMLSWTDWPQGVLETFRRGTVIPAHLLALDSRRQFDTRRQRALSRYYIDAGAGGLAVGVHSTQFAIRDAGLYQPVLRMAAETAASWCPRPLVLIAGLVGRTEQAKQEAEIAVGLGYRTGLFSLAAMKEANEDELTRTAWPSHVLCRLLASICSLQLAVLRSRRISGAGLWKSSR